MKKPTSTKTHPQNPRKTISEATRGHRMHRCDALASLGTKLHSVGNPPPGAHLRPHPLPRPPAQVGNERPDPFTGRAQRPRRRRGSYNVPRSILNADRIDLSGFSRVGV